MPQEILDALAPFGGADAEAIMFDAPLGSCMLSRSLNSCEESAFSPELNAMFKASNNTKQCEILVSILDIVQKGVNVNIGLCLFEITRAHTSTLVFSLLFLLYLPLLD